MTEPTPPERTREERLDQARDALRAARHKDTPRTKEATCPDAE